MKNVTPFIEGSTFVLRPLSLEDVSGNYVNWFNDSEVCKYNSHHVFPYTPDAAREYVQKIQTSRTDLVLAIVAKDTNQHIGNISLQQINLLSRNAEYAIIIGERSYWGKGIAKEASQLIIEHGFATLNLHRIYCGTSVENEPMQRLASALGFVKEGVRTQAMFKNGAFVDIVEYGMLRENFKKS